MVLKDEEAVEKPGTANAESMANASGTWSKRRVVEGTTNQVTAEAAQKRKAVEKAPKRGTAGTALNLRRRSPH